MNRSGAPSNCWLLCLIYVCYLLNHIVCTALDGKIPLFALIGITPDISIILLFTFYQPVFYATYDQNFPSESEEMAGYWVGFGEDCGDAMTHKILDHENQKIIYRSAVRPKKSSTPDTIPTKNGRELMEKWVSELKDKFLGPNWQRMLSCAYTTQLLHSTGEVCWNNRDSYFIWFKFVC